MLTTGVMLQYREATRQSAKDQIIDREKRRSDKTSSLFTALTCGVVRPGRGKHSLRDGRTPSSRRQRVHMSLTPARARTLRLRLTSIEPASVARSCQCTSIAAAHCPAPRHRSAGVAAPNWNPTASRDDVFFLP